MKELKNLAIGIARMTGALLFLFGMILVSCDAYTISVQLILGGVGLAMVFGGVILAQVGTEEEYDC